MGAKNATYLFEYPKGTFHNSERYWAAFFALFVLQEAQSLAPRELPAYNCDRDGRITVNGSVRTSDLRFQDVIVDGRLRLRDLWFEGIAARTLELTSRSIDAIARWYSRIVCRPRRPLKHPV